MKETIDLGTVPLFENSIEPNSPHYETLLKKECARFIDCIREACGPEPEGVELSITKGSHESAKPLTVVMKFDPLDDRASYYASRVQTNGPSTWN